MNEQPFGDCLRDFRNARKIGLRAAAKQIGISHATLSRIERGYMPDIPSLYRCCEWSGIGLKIAVFKLLAPKLNPSK